MAFSAVLDTCVLYPAHLRDTVLRLAERDLYRPRWSADIVDELRRNLIDLVDRAAVDRLLAGSPPRSLALRSSATGHSSTDWYVIRRTAMSSPQRSEPTLARSSVQHPDFPHHSVAPFELEIIHPDTFLLDLLDLAPGAVIDELSRQASANRRAPTTLPQLLDALARAGIPAFADEVRRRTARGRLAP